MKITNNYTFHGELSVPGDKSISHRGIMFGAVSDGLTEITNFLQGADCLSTISCFQKLGISIENTGSSVLIHGKGLHGLTAPHKILDVGNSGTTTRLISGILAGQSLSFPSCFCSGKVCHPACRSVCRKYYQCDRACTIQKSH